MTTICSILLASFGLVYGEYNAAAFASERAPPLFGSAGEGTTSSFVQGANPHYSGLVHLGQRVRRFHGVLQRDSAMLLEGSGNTEYVSRLQVPQESFLQLQSDSEESDSEYSKELGGSSASSGDSHTDKHRGPTRPGSEARSAHEEDKEAPTASKKERGTDAAEDSKWSATEEEGSQASSEEHAPHSAKMAANKDHAEGEGGISETATHKEEEQGETSGELGHGDKTIISDAKAKSHEPLRQAEGISEHEGAKLHEPAHEEEGISEHEGAKPDEPVHKTEGTSEREKAKQHVPGHKAEGGTEHQKEKPHEPGHNVGVRTQEVKAKAHMHGAGQAKLSQEEEVDSLISRLLPLLRAAKGKDLYERLVTILDLHERTVEAEKELKSEAKKEEAQEEALKEKAVSNVAAQEDLLLTQQLSNMWVLPFYEEGKRETCLSGFEGLAHEATITCSDPECFKLETQAQQCHYMSVGSIMRKEDFDTKAGQPKGEQKPHPQAAQGHMLLGFDGQCRQPETLGSEILNMLQHPRQLAKQHALERSTGSGGTVPLQKHHLDVICDTEEKSEYPSCKTVYEALQHVKEPKPRALPELLVLTDIQDLKNTLGLYRIAFLFEGLVQFATPDGTKVDASQHKLPKEEAEFMRKHRHDDISTTALLKAE